LADLNGEGAKPARQSPAGGVIWPLFARDATRAVLSASGRKPAKMTAVLRDFDVFPAETCHRAEPASIAISERRWERDEARFFESSLM